MDLSNNFTFYICGQRDVQKFRDKKINIAISFSHPGNQELANYTGFYDDPVFELHEFIFHDAWADWHKDQGLKWPQKENIKDILAIAESIKGRLNNGERVNCLFQCHAGISRSTATAFIILAYLMGEYSEREAAKLILDKRAIANPNPVMVKMADELMGRSWKLIVQWPNCVDFARGNEEDRDHEAL
jgi:predicted protein tyrosine phosphatase